MALLDNSMDNAQVGKIKSLFQQGYKLLYESEMFDNIQDMAKEDPVLAVSQSMSALAAQMFKQLEGEDATVIISAMVGLVGEVVEALNEIGIPVDQQQVNDIITETVKLTLGNLPDMAEQLANDPSVQENLRGMQQPQQQQQQQPQQQGLLGA